MKTKPETKVSHTPMPGDIDDIRELLESSGRPWDKEEIEFIIRACNSYEALLEALRKIAKPSSGVSLVHSFDEDDSEELKEIARDAIAKAEGKQS